MKKQIIKYGDKLRWLHNDETIFFLFLHLLPLCKTVTWLDPNIYFFKTLTCDITLQICVIKDMTLSFS